MAGTLSDGAAVALFLPGLLKCEDVELSSGALRRHIPVEWQAHYSVGNPAMDHQHKKLLTILGQAAAFSSEIDAEYVGQFHATLNELADYARIHFHAEESLMASVSCPFLESHRDEHNNYWNSITELLVSATNGNYRNSDLLAWITAWWLDHILVSDMRYKEYVQNEA